MRQNGPFSIARSQPQTEPKPPPSRAELVRQRLKHFYQRFHVILLVGVGIIIALASVFVYEGTRPAPQRLTQRDINRAVEQALATMPPPPSVASQAYQKIRPSVVSVRAIIPGSGGKNEPALGAGVVIDDTGMILTCWHVVQDAAEIRVIFADGTESEASVILKQPENDLAVLRPQLIPDDLLPAVLTASATLRVGDEVVAVGNPFGMLNSTSAGVVSGLGRNFKSTKTGETLRDLIQFDAAVNPGNSGGPLVNRDGEVVGIVTALVNPTEQEFFIGIGLAIPMETAGGAAGAPPL